MKRAFDGFLVLLLAAGLSIHAALCMGAGEANWSYAGPTGPAKWGSLSKDFALCKSGQTQSPIDIPDADARKGDMPPLLFNYKPSALRIIDNGHTIQVNYAPDSWVTVEGMRYDLVEIHFHKPGEEKINGKSYDMSAQLVHRSKDHNVAIVAVLLEQGKENALIKTLWTHLPQTREKENAVDAVKINALGLLPQNKDYYTFAGSLTTPPCTENVKWFVLKTPTQIAADQIARFARTYPMNARPVQPLNSRDILGSR